MKEDIQEKGVSEHEEPIKLPIHENISELFEELIKIAKKISVEDYIKLLDSVRKNEDNI